jgi:hypothetical protein
MSVLCSGGAFESILPSARASENDLVASFSLARATVDSVNAGFSLRTQEARKQATRQCRKPNIL